jgi:hypothetical protein
MSTPPKLPRTIDRLLRPRVGETLSDRARRLAPDLPKLAAALGAPDEAGLERLALAPDPRVRAAAVAVVHCGAVVALLSAATPEAQYDAYRQVVRADELADRAGGVARAVRNTTRPAPARRRAPRAWTPRRARTTRRPASPGSDDGPPAPPAPAFAGGAS